MKRATKKHERMTKAELVKCIKALEREGSPASLAVERDQLLHELQVHQVELETQNRELREAQLLLEGSRDRYADLYDFAPVGYVTFDDKGVIREINLTAAGMLGVDRTRLLGVPFHLHVAREDLAHFRAHLNRHENPEERVATELRLARKDGVTLPIVMQSVLAYDTEKKTHLCRAALTDVTARRQAEQALQSSEERYRLLAEHADDFVCLNDTHGSRLYISPSFFRRTGWTPEEVQASDWRTRLHPDDLTLVERAREANLAGEATTIEHRIKCRDGSWLWVEARCKPIADASGIIVRLVLWSREITERKRAAEALERKQSELEEAQRIGLIGNWHWDARTDVTTGSDQLLRIYGLNPGTQPMPDFREQRGRLYPAAAWERLNAAVQATMQTGDGFELTLEAIRNGAPIWVRSRSEAVRDGTGRIIGLRGTVQDVTERMELERQLLEISEVERRTIGHELHDSLGQRLTALEMLSHGLMEDLKSHAPSLLNAAALLNRELRETVTQARLLSHGLAPVPLDGEGLMRGCAELAASISLLPGVKCRFVCDPPVQLQSVTIATQLYRIAQEAVNNALKHGHASQVDIHLTRQDGEVVLCVKNNGNALPKDHPANSGKSLNVMRYRAEMIGASLAIESGRRKGVQVTCTLKGTP